MRLVSIAAAIALGGLALAGCAGTGSSPSYADVATSSKAGWGPHGKPLYYFFVYSNATPGSEEEFNRWYDRIHAPAVIENGEFVWAQRFEYIPRSRPGDPDDTATRRQYLAIFALETNDLTAAIAEVDKRVALPRNVRSRALDYTSLQLVPWKALGPPISQKEAQRLLAEEEALGNVPRAATTAGRVPPPVGARSSAAVGTSSKAGWGPRGKQLHYFMVFSNATPGNDEEFNRWYDRIHAPLVIEHGEFVWAQRFELAPQGFGGGPGTAERRTRQYLVIFALETNDLDAAMTEADTRVMTPRNVRSGTIDYKNLGAEFWKALGPPITQKDAKRLLAEEEAAGNVPKVAH